MDAKLGRVPRRSPSELALALCGLIAPPRCIACGALEEGGLSERLCHRCRRLLGAGPLAAGRFAGIDAATAVAPYRGPAAGLVAALKRGRPGAAETAAELLAESLPAPATATALVPVPGAPLRRAARGLDPGVALARALAPRLGIPVASPLRRRDSGRQRGRDRRRRLADPPRFEAFAGAPARALVVDDVITTGATVVACARALRRAGAERVSVAAVARTGSPSRPS